MRIARLLRTPLAIGLIVTLGSSVVTRAADRAAREILAELKAIRTPDIRSKDREDPAKLQAYRAAVKDAMDQRMALIGELYRTDPGNSELPRYAPTYWYATMRTPEGEAKVKAELEAIMARDDAPALVVEAAYFQANLALTALGREPKFADMMPPIRAFTDRFPTDKRSATLLKRAANLIEDPSQKAEMLAQIEQDFPDTPEARRLADERQKLARVGKPFELEFTDATSGKTITMNQLKGKVVVVDFWATWCGPCVAELPRMKQLYADYHDKGVEFIGISLDAPKEQGGLDKLKKFVAENKVEWPQYYQGNGWDSAFSSSWAIHAIPALFLVDAEGNLASINARGNLEELLPEYLKKAKKAENP